MKMKALIKETPREGALMKEVDVPAIRDHEVLVKVKRAAICGTDIHIYFWTAFAQERLKLPMIFGHEFCGEVVEVGRTVKRVKPGDLVAAETHIPCEVCFQCNTGLMHICKEMKIIGVHTAGAFSEYTALPEICAWRLSPKTSPFPDPPQGGRQTGSDRRGGADRPLCGRRCQTERCHENFLHRRER